MCIHKYLTCYCCKKRQEKILEKKCIMKECTKLFLKHEKILCLNCNQVDTATLQKMFSQMPAISFETVYIKTGNRNF